MCVSLPLSLSLFFFVFSLLCSVFLPLRFIFGSLFVYVCVRNGMFFFFACFFFLSCCFRLYFSRPPSSVAGISAASSRPCMLSPALSSFLFLRSRPLLTALNAQSCNVVEVHRKMRTSKTRPPTSTCEIGIHCKGKSVSMQNHRPSREPVATAPLHPRKRVF